MSPELPQWTDRAGVTHQLQSARVLSTAERRQLDILRQQVRYTAHLLDAGFSAPAVAQAPRNLMRMMLRLLLPNVAEEEIATFDPTKGHDLLTRWWEVTDAAA